MSVVQDAVVFRRDITSIIAALDGVGAECIRKASGGKVSIRRFNTGHEKLVLLSTGETNEHIFQVDGRTLALSNCSGMIFSEINARHVPICVPPKITLTTRAVSAVLLTRSMHDVLLTRSTHDVLLTRSTHDTADTEKPTDASTELKEACDASTGLGEACGAQVTSVAISPIYDGTAFTLYYNNGWHMGTANGIDVRKFIPSYTKKSFLELLCECLRESWKNVCKRLDTECCYTCVFQHPELHQTVDTPRCITICTLHLNSMVEDYGVVAELPNATPDIICNVAIDELTKELLPDYSLGYIVRTNAANVRYETRAMADIKHYWYDAKRFKSTADNKKLLVILSAFVENNEKYFAKLFPRYEEAVNIIADDIESIAVAITNRCDVGGNIGKFTKKLSDIFYRIAPFEPNVSLVRSWLLSPESFDHLLEYFSSNPVLQFE